MLISDAYRELNAKMHKTNVRYGVKSFKRGGDVLAILKSDPLIESVLDYGAGKNTLFSSLKDKIHELEISWQSYDPAIPELDIVPEPADLVICTDVLEHVEPEYIDNVLNHLRQLTKRKLYVTISFVKSNDVLPDGSAAHRIIMDEAAWRKKLTQAGFSFDGAEYASNKQEIVVCLRVV